MVGRLRDNDRRKTEKALGLGLAQGQPTDLDNLYSGAIGGAATLSVPLGQVDAFVGATLLYHLGGRLKLDLGNRVDRDDLSLVFYGGELGFTRLKAPVIVRPQPGHPRQDDGRYGELQ
jgi:hypothetical protein